MSLFNSGITPYLGSVSLLISVLDGLAYAALRSLWRVYPIWAAPYHSEATSGRMAGWAGMRTFEFYCAICAGPFYLDTDHLLSSTSTSITEKNLEWLKRLRVIGRNLRSNKAYVSGPGKTEQFGSVRVEIGEDLNFPVSSSPGVGGMISMSCYFDWSNMGGGDKHSPFPVHCQCWQVLQQAYDCRQRRNMRRRGGSALPSEMNLDVIRSVMEDLLQGGTTCLGGMYYFEFQSEPYEDVWDSDDSVKSRLDYLCEPTGFEKMMLQALQSSCETVSSFVTSSLKERPTVTIDPFNRLPTEIVMQLVEDLSANSLRSLLQSSKSVEDRCDDDMFWLRRISRDMAYIDEADLQSLLRSRVKIDWQELHDRLLKASRARLGEASETEQSMVGLASRRRVWACAEQLLNLYDQHSIDVEQ